MEIKFLNDNADDINYNRKIFKRLTNYDFEMIADKIIRKLNNNEDEIQLNFFFDVKIPHFIFVEKINSSSPAVEYYKSHCEMKEIKEIGIIYDIDSYEQLGVCNISNKTYDELENNIKI